ncbi:MAG: hypothetical protein LBJ96_00205 [Holosporaceae bacterium]|nr:hypothetical protein [Holosporaceae bacterium]
MARMREKVKFVGYEMANILQNISQNRVDKKITKDDIKHAVAAAYLSVYQGKTMYTTSRLCTPLGHASSGNLYCVKGLENGNASVIWCHRWHSANNSPSPAEITIENRDSRSIVNMGSNSPSKIYPDLRIQKGEMKILVEVCFHYSKSSGYGFTDSRMCADVSSKTAFGFFVLNPPRKGDSIYFNTVVIFTPKPGLFDDTAPV